MFHCLVIKVSVSRQLHQITTSSNTCQQLFSSFLRFFSTTYAVFCGFCHLSLTTRLLYHMFSHLSTTIFIFLKNHQIVSFRKTILSDSSIRIPQETMHVNNFFHFYLHLSIFYVVFYLFLFFSPYLFFTSIIPKAGAIFSSPAFVILRI